MQHFNVVVVGTALTESITAAALAKAGCTVLHVDTLPYYGADQASLSLTELALWSALKDNFSAKSISPHPPPLARQYALSLAPSLIPATGPLISALIASGVARYGGFTLLQRAAVYSSGSLHAVPGSKEAVFKSTDISLVDKRRLMRFLLFAASDFESAPELQDRAEMPFIQFLEQVFLLNQPLAATVAYALALSPSPADTTLAALHRTRQYLRSTGRYGPSPFLVGHYGGLGELAQGFCRSCAVSGGTYILGRPIVSLTRHTQSASTDGASPRFTIQIQDIPDALTADLVIAPPHLLPPELQPQTQPHSGPQQTTAFGIAIIDQPIGLTPPPRDEADSATNESLDTALIVFPPGSLDGAHGAAVNVLIHGEDTMSCPRGKHILYLSTQLAPSPAHDPPSPAAPDPESLLRPFLARTLALIAPPDTAPLFTAFYAHHAPPPTGEPEPGSDPRVLLVPAPPVHLAANADAAAEAAEALFWRAVGVLRPPASGAAVEAFWPPLEADPNEDDAW